MVLVLACVVFFAIIAMLDVVTKKEKRFMTRLLVGSSVAFVVACILGSHFNVSSSTALPTSCEVLSSTSLSSDRTRYQLRSLSGDGAMFTRTFKEGKFPPPGYQLVSLEGRKLLLPKD